jgi:hypothetical protein
MRLDKNRPVPGSVSLQKLNRKCFYKSFISKMGSKSDPSEALITTILHEHYRGLYMRYDEKVSISLTPLELA